MATPRSSVLAAVVLLALVGTACPVPRHMRTAMTYQASGKDYSAALEYLAVLDRKPSHGDARFGLQATAEPGYRQRIATAEAFRNEGSFRQAAALYDELSRYSHRLERHGALDFEVPDLRGRAAEMREAAVAADFRSGEIALDRGDWATAFDKFERVKSERPKWPGLSEALAKTWYGSARENELGHRYRVAAEQYQGADEAFGKRYLDARNRAGTVMTALGRHHYQVGSCRQAWRDLKVADRLSDISTLPSEVNEAWACAVSTVVVEPVEMRFGSDVAGIDVGAVLRGKAVDIVETDKSQFVQLVDPSQADLADFSVRVRLTEAWAQTDTTRTNETAAGTRRRICFAENDLGERVETTCDEPVELRYERVDVHAGAQVVGKVAVVHKSTRVRSTRELGRREDSTVAYAHDFLDQNGPVVVSQDLDEGVVVDDALLQLATAPRETVPERELARNVLLVLGEEVANFTLAAVDTDNPASDRADLELGLE